MAYILKNKTFLLLLLILAIASFFRLWQLNAIPPGLYPDVAINGNDALDSIKTGDFKLFYPENNGREGLMMWLVAFSFSIFGASVWSIKIVAAIIGISTVLGTYLLTKELFNKNVALISSFFLSVSFWHVNFSRFGFRAILVPFVLVFGFYFLFRGFKQEKILPFILSGIFFGLGFYTYISYRFIVLLLPIILLFWFLIYRNKKQIKIFSTHTIYWLLTITAVALPIGVYFISHPQDFVGRASGVSIFSQANPIAAFFVSLGAHLAMFNLWGDNNWRHNFSGAPELFWPVGILFLIGIILSAREIFKKSNYKNLPSVIGYWLLAAWLFLMLLPGILTFEGVPHALRTIGAIPPAYILAGLGAWKVYQFLSHNTKRKKLLIFASFFFLFAVALAGFNQYFVKWAKNPNTKGAFTKNYLEIGNALNLFPPTTKKYVIVNEPGVPVPWPDGIPMPAQTIMFIESAKYGAPQSTYLLPQDIDKIKIEKGVMIVLMKDDEELSNKIRERFSTSSGYWIVTPE
jgi:4-amino-4-deoxy-L-arabinose transferase-like glycosyltransferase